MKYKLLILAFFCFSVVYSQYRVDLNIGIENPYLYGYNFEQLPSFYAYDSQPLIFFRTKHISGGFSYDFRLGVNDFLRFNIGSQIGYMNQFIADTILSPKMNKILYNVRHESFYFEPSMSFGSRIYKNLVFNYGMFGFVPISKTIYSDSERIKMTNELAENFYPTNLYVKLCMQYDYKKYLFGIEFQQPFEPTLFWLKFPNFSSPRSSISHMPIRWMLRMSYLFTK